MASEKEEKKTDTWMPLYVSDYLGDTMHLTTEQHGAYMLLLMACWKGDGKLPNRDSTLAAITRMPAARWKASRMALLGFFEIADDFITQKRVLKERAKAKEISAKRTESGRLGGSKKQANAMANAIANGVANGQQKATPSPSPIRANEANASGAGAPPDPIWGTGLAFLTRKGIPVEQARKFLGKLRKQAGDVQIAAILADCEAHDISDPIPWLSRAAVNARAGRAPSKTLGAIHQLEAMKHGLAGNRNPDGLSETALLGFGSDPGD